MLSVHATLETVPSLEYDTESAEYMDDVLVQMSQVCKEKSPYWKTTLQRWGAIFIVNLLRLREYGYQQYEKLKASMYAMFYHDTNHSNNQLGYTLSIPGFTIRYTP
jgi:hypothetical protein